MPTPGGPVYLSLVHFTQSSLELTIPEEDSSLEEKKLQEELERIQREFEDKKVCTILIFLLTCPLPPKHSSIIQTSQHR